MAKIIEEEALTIGTQSYLHKSNKVFKLVLSLVTIFLNNSFEVLLELITCCSRHMTMLINQAFVCDSALLKSNAKIPAILNN